MSTNNDKRVLPVNKKKFNYRKQRVVCDGLVTGCEHCKDIHPPAEGYCTYCHRPLWKEIGERCGFVLGYLDIPQDKNPDFSKGKKGRPSKLKGSVDFRCYMCNTITTRNL